MENPTLSNVMCAPTRASAVTHGITRACLCPASGICTYTSLTSLSTATTHAQCQSGTMVTQKSAHRSSIGPDNLVSVCSVTCDALYYIRVELSLFQTYTILQPYN